MCLLSLVEGKEEVLGGCGFHGVFVCGDSGFQAVHFGNVAVECDGVIFLSLHYFFFSLEVKLLKYLENFLFSSSCCVVPTYCKFLIRMLHSHTVLRLLCVSRRLQPTSYKLTDLLREMNKSVEKVQMK